MFKKFRDSHNYYIIFKDGEFVETLHNKESFHLSAQIEKSENREDEELFNVVKQVDQKINDILPTKRFPWVQAIFVILLVVMFSFLTFSYVQSWNKSAAYISMVPTAQIKDIQTGVNDNVSENSELLNDLTYALHVHHAINDLYEKAKTVVTQFANAEITFTERNEQLTMIATQVKGLIEYNSNQSDQTKLTEHQSLYSTADTRLNHFLEILRDVASSKGRVATVNSLNDGIQADEPFFATQVSNFKQLLNRYEVQFTEKNGKLSFDFPVSK